MQSLSPLSLANLHMILLNIFCIFLFFLVFKARDQTGAQYFSINAAMPEPMAFTSIKASASLDSLPTMSCFSFDGIFLNVGLHCQENIIIFHLKTQYNLL